MVMTCQSQHSGKLRILDIQKHATSIDTHPVQYSEQAAHTSPEYMDSSCMHSQGAYCPSQSAVPFKTDDNRRILTQSDCHWCCISRHTPNMRLQNYLLLLPLLTGFSSDPFMLCAPPELLLPGGYLLHNVLALLIQQWHPVSE